MPRLASFLAPDDHERRFLARYALVWRHALRLTGDPAGADDLAQDAYLRFTLTRPDLSRLDNTDGYLITLVRNIHLSRVRRASHRSERSLDLLDYDSAELVASRTDPRAWLLARHLLRGACAYGCARRRSAKTGSVFLLRFFHALAPSEIALITHAANRTVEEWVRLGRQEARQYLTDPSRLAFVSRTSTVERTPTSEPRPSSVGHSVVDHAMAGSTDIVGELRAEIFSHRHAQCFSPSAWDDIYRNADEPIATETLAEIVTCPDCLDHALGRHDLPLLSGRSPFDSVRDKQVSRAPLLDRATQIRGARLLSEHRPHALFLAVNGFIVGQEHVSGERSEMTVSMTLAEPVAFVELLSEQEVCLLHLVIDLPPGGDVRQTASASLSDGRSVELEVSFSESWPKVRAAYIDPAASFVARSLPGVATKPDAGAGQPGSSSLASCEKPRQAIAVVRWWRQIREALQPRPIDMAWLRPSRVLTMVVLIAVVGYAINQMTRPTATAAEILRDAARSDEVWGAAPGQVAHRVVRLQERVAGSSVIRSERQIETWQDAGRIKATRLYDAEHHLIAGEWRQADGTRKVYHAGAPAKTELAKEARSIAPDEIWRWDAAAADFGALVGNSTALSVEKSAKQVVLQASHVSDLLESATLTVSPDTHRTIGQTLVVRVGETLLEYRFEETLATRMPASEVPPDRFEPEAVLSGNHVSSETVAAPSVARVPRPAPSFAVAALDRLELTATWRLHRLGSCLAVPGRIERSPRSGIHIDVLAAGLSCRAE
ncbi:MAG TPA: RNA polymerase sigma factor, partial [Vicinamibacterales bacterium]|nr:RNA polymerase sigma factor [Vicinamibacterales bacterium]